jgi:hypothetical protein
VLEQPEQCSKPTPTRELISRTVHGTYWGNNLRVLFTFTQGITS